MRTLTKPSTALCTLEHYTAFLLAEVSGGEFAHDAANRFRSREQFSPRDLFEAARPRMALAGGTLSVDDSVLEKPYRQEGKADLVGSFWSSKAGGRRAAPSRACVWSRSCTPTPKVFSARSTSGSWARRRARPGTSTFATWSRKFSAGVCARRR